MSYLKALRESNPPLLRPARDHAPEPPYRTPAAPAPKPGTLLCSVTDCFEPALPNGFCEKHYQEWEVDEP